MRTESIEPTLTLESLGFLLAKASQRFNERLVERFAEEGFAEVRASYGSVLLPLFEHDGMRVGEIGARARLSKQSMTRLVAQCEAAGLVRRRRDTDDGRAFRVELTRRGRRLRSVAERVLGELDDEVAAVLGGRHDALKRALKGVMEL
ncbi:MAG: MarR family winged helix-turn-helix transcriptional regulator [Solirubrobacteraceae bacterium]